MYNESKINSMSKKNPMGKIGKKAFKGQVKAIKKGTKIQNVKSPAGKAKANKAKSVNGSSNKNALQKPKAPTSKFPNKIDYKSFFENDANPFGGFKGVTDTKKY